MAIRTNKGQKINGVFYPAGMAIVGLDKKVEALAAEGGGATPVNLAVFEVNSSGQIVDEAGNPVSGYRIVYQNNAIVQSSDTGVATANALASFVLPGGSMGPNGWLRFTMIMKGIDAINAAKNTRLWANSTRIFENGTTTTAGVVQYQFNWFNSNSESAQTSFYKDQLAYGTTGATAGSSAINTAQDITFYLTGDSASAAGPTIQKCAFMVELLRG